MHSEHSQRFIGKEEGRNGFWISTQKRSTVALLLNGAKKTNEHVAYSQLLKIKCLW